MKIIQRLIKFTQVVGIIGAYPTYAAADTAMRSIDLSAKSTIQPVSANATNHGIGPKIFVNPQQVPITTTFDKDTPYHITISGDDGYSLMLKIDREARNSDANQKSKIEINLVRNDDAALDVKNHGNFILKNGQGDYLGFGFKMDQSGYEFPDRWVLHFQVYQCCLAVPSRPSLHVQPPLELMAEPQSANLDNNVKFVLIARNDSYAANVPTHDNGERLSFLDGKQFVFLRRGEWYSVAYYLKPDPGSPNTNIMGSNKGQIDMWINGKLILKYVGKWGYTSDISGDTVGNYGIKLGIYRAAQDRSQQIYLKNVEWCHTRSVGCLQQELSN